MTTLNIRKIDTSKKDARDVISWLRETRLGRVYIRYLKQYNVVRLLAQWAWRNGYPIYVRQVSSRLLNRNAKRWRALISLSDYSKKKRLSTCRLADESLVKVPTPKVFPVCEQDYLDSHHDQYVFPEVYVATINNAMVYGGTSLILADDEVICHDLYDFVRDYTSEELHGRILINSKSRRIRWLLHDKKPEPVQKAAVFVDACAPNYAHWVTEVLPRISLFCSDNSFKDVAIVVNDGLHENIMESLALVTGLDRQIILLPVGRGLVVDELYLTSVAGYVPFERRKKGLSGYSHGVFSSAAFELMYNKVISVANNIPDCALPEKIYLRRNSGVRNITNSAELEKYLVGEGYVVVEPEKLSFLQQVNLFANAKVIIGATGAALANILFAPKNAKIYILISKHPDTSYWYWQNMACASGKIINYILGDILAGEPKGIHADFEVNLATLISSLEG